MSEHQATIKKEFTLSGVGLHTGNQVQVKFKPAPEDAGVNFIRMDLPHHPVLKANALNVLVDDSVPRCTTIGQGPMRIHTVEHLLSVLNGLGVDNIHIEVNGNELPGLDGSGIEFLKAIQKAGLVSQNASRRIFYVKEPLGVECNGCSIFIFPSSELRISYALDYDHPLLKSQFVSLKIDPQSYEREIAPCRTFCLEKEAKELQANGLGKGANFQNTLVVGSKGVIDNKVRFPDEFARHKILDFIGDLYLLGMPIRGHVFATKSGHTLNLRLLKAIVQQKDKYEISGKVASYDLKGKPVFEIQDIMKILPHRYPFLLVDRVMIAEHGKKAVGIKNVTINDNFFQGHFPTRPVMPGVMMVEAMAQAAGVVVLTNEAHRGKLAFFMAADQVKFRRVVVPGDQLVMEVDVLRDRSKTTQLRCIAKVGDEIACEAELVFSFTDASYL